MSAARPGSPSLYAITRKLHPRTGHLVVREGKWERGVPMLEVVLRVLRTSLGDYPPDPTFGVDYARVERGAPNAGAQLQHAIEAALIRYTRAGQIRALTVDVQRSGDRLLYDIAFVDPRADAASARTSVRGLF